MPPILPDDDIGLAFDMHGCPNRCRHCWLDHEVVATPRTRMSEDDVRWLVNAFGLRREAQLSYRGKHFPNRNSYRVCEKISDWGRLSTRRPADKSVKAAKYERDLQNPAPRSSV